MYTINYRNTDTHKSTLSQSGVYIHHYIHTPILRSHTNERTVTYMYFGIEHKGIFQHLHIEKDTHVFWHMHLLICIRRFDQLITYIQAKIP